LWERIGRTKASACSVRNDGAGFAWDKSDAGKMPALRHKCQRTDLKIGHYTGKAKPDAARFEAQGELKPADTKAKSRESQNPHPCKPKGAAPAG